MKKEGKDEKSRIEKKRAEGLKGKEKGSSIRTLSNGEHQNMYIHSRFRSLYDTQLGEIRD